MDGVEQISHDGRVLAFVIRGQASAPETTFFTADDSTFQAGFVVYPAGGAVQPHVHLPLERRVIGTAELLVVRSGRCVVDLYADDRLIVTSRELSTGDAVLSLGGGHGFRMLEDTVILELKQGPYVGGNEKERFEPGAGTA
jgi:hypothetical protein